MKSDVSIAELLLTLDEALTAAGIEPRPDAELIIGHVLGESRGRVQALAIMGGSVSAEDHARIRELTEVRAQRVPLQHLTGKAAFRALNLSVGPGVFVPRPETESVAQLAIDALQAVPSDAPIAVDLCAGSGALALALANEVPTARVWAVEASREAHAWAARNVAEFGEGRVRLLLEDIRKPGRELHGLAGTVDVLVSNPPYIPDEMVPRDPEVRDHDPELALYGGHDGLDLVRVISALGLDLLRAGGTLVLEHAEMQGAAIRGLLAADGWRSPATHQDLTLRDRATTALR